MIVAAIKRILKLKLFISMDKSIMNLIILETLHMAKVMKKPTIDGIKNAKIHSIST